MKATEFHTKLKCGVLRLAYDFDSATGTLHVPDGHCCDMKGCIDLFKEIDPAVQAIDTFSGVKPDTRYRRVQEDWTAGFSH